MRERESSLKVEQSGSKESVSYVTTDGQTFVVRYGSEDTHLALARIAFMSRNNTLTYRDAEILGRMIRSREQDSARLG